MQSKIFIKNKMSSLLVLIAQIVRPGGMERPTDAYKETHNITLSEEDTLFGGQVSNLQVCFIVVSCHASTNSFGL